jgi:hypothetical protein
MRPCTITLLPSGKEGIPTAGKRILTLQIVIQRWENVNCHIEFPDIPYTYMFVSERKNAIHALSIARLLSLIRTFIM